MPILGNRIVGNGEKIKKQTTQQIVDRLMQLKPGSRIHILAPIIRGKKGKHKGVIEKFVKMDSCELELMEKF